MSGCWVVLRGMEKPSLASAGCFFDLGAFSGFNGLDDGFHAEAFHAEQGASLSTGR
jgi:hypothetical protein